MSTGPRPGHAGARLAAAAGGGRAGDMPGTMDKAHQAERLITIRLSGSRTSLPTPAP
jgi:hypothetical protein